MERRAPARLSKQGRRPHTGGVSPEGLWSCGSRGTQHLSSRGQNWKDTTTPEKIIYFNVSEALSTFIACMP